MWDLSFLEQYCLRLKFSEILRYLYQKIFTNVSNDRNAFFFMGTLLGITEPNDEGTVIQLNLGNYLPFNNA
jgi:hypothetical protein